MVEIQQVRQEQFPILREMMGEYLKWALSLHPDSVNAPTFQGVDDELKDLPGIFAPPKGRFLMADIEGRVVGCGALKPIDESTCELKRLFVRPDARGEGVGLALVERVIRDARQIGYKRIILDSHKLMHAAHHVYRTVGFKDVAPWENFPEALKPEVVFMEKDLQRI